MADTVILGPFLKCPAFLHLGKYKNYTFCHDKGVKIILFQSNQKNSWRGFLGFQIWRTFTKRLHIHFFQPILICCDTLIYAKKAGHFKNGPKITVSAIVYNLEPISRKLPLVMAHPVYIFTHTKCVCVVPIIHVRLLTCI